MTEPRADLLEAPNDSALADAVADEVSAMADLLLTSAREHLRARGLGPRYEGRPQG